MSKLCGMSKASKLWKPSLVDAASVSRNAVPRKQIYNHWTWREPKRTLVRTHDMWKSKQTMHHMRSRTCTSLVRNRRLAPVSRDSTLSTISCVKQVRAQAVLVDSSFCTPFDSLSHHVERKDAVLEQREVPISSSQTTAWTRCSATRKTWRMEREVTMK